MRVVPSIAQSLLEYVYVPIPSMARRCIIEKGPSVCDFDALL